MTYLGYPRLHFAGSFQADPSTVNNDPAHFDDATFQARFQQPQVGENPAPDQMNGWWNPRGSGAWRLANCMVTSVLYQDGSSAASSLADPIVGGMLAGSDSRVSAKLVDLDPEQQMVSEIWGLRLRLRDSQGQEVWNGSFEVAPFTDIWVRYRTGQPDSYYGAFYQSIISGVEWAGELNSLLLQQMKEAAYQGQLSIKFNVDGYDDDVTSPTFTWGRIVGSIGPYLQGEPKHFVAARYLQSPPGSPLNNAPARLDEASKTLFLDLGNSLPTTSVDGPLVNINALRMRGTPIGGLIQVVAQPPKGAPPVVLASIDNLGGFYEHQAAILSAELTDAQVKAAASYPIGVVDSTGTLTMLSENAAATYVRADTFVFRTESAKPNNTASTTLYATTLGKPTSGVQIDVWNDDAAEQGQVTQGPVSGPPVGTPPKGISFPDSIKTGPDGTAELTLTASPPGNPRGYIDGQVYGLAYGWGHDDSVAGGSQLSVLVFDDYQAPARPTWVADVLPILQQYANLYPVMRDILDLSDYHSVVQHRSALRLVFSLPVEDPNYMPVTRDLSPQKRAMLLSWLAEPDPPLLEVADLDGLKSALQLAIELEHATIPPYLCALLSIKQGRNREVAGLIRSVVIEEMLHMALACNLLNAVGGAPVIDRPGFVPRYPGHLPAGLRPDLTVGLRRCSIDQIRDVFMSIELPDDVLLEPAADEIAADTMTPHAMMTPLAAVHPTIGAASVAVAGLPVIDTRGVAVDQDGDIVSAFTPLTDGMDAAGPADASFAAAPAAAGPSAAATSAAATAAAALEQWFTSVTHPSFTIGWFYNQIARAIITLSDAGVNLFTGDPSRQLTPAVWPNAPGRLYRITNKENALLAIHEIVRQGEGTSLNDPTDGRDELAHYFKFKEIVEGRQMIPNAEGKWVFEGPPIPFDQDGVYPMVNDPDPAALPQGSQVQAIARLFDVSYGDLLRSIQATVNGQPERLREAIGLMYTLEIQARELMRTPISPGSPTTAGPAFLAE
jgi:hypothetical protein